MKVDDKLKEAYAWMAFIESAGVDLNVNTYWADITLRMQKIIVDAKREAILDRYSYVSPIQLKSALFQGGGQRSFSFHQTTDGTYRRYK